MTHSEVQLKLLPCSLRSFSAFIVCMISVPCWMSRIWIRLDFRFRRGVAIGVSILGERSGSEPTDGSINRNEQREKKGMTLLDQCHPIHLGSDWKQNTCHQSSSLLRGNGIGRGALLRKKEPAGFFTKSPEELLAGGRGGPPEMGANGVDPVGPVTAEVPSAAVPDAIGCPVGGTMLEDIGKIGELCSANFRSLSPRSLSTVDESRRLKCC